MLSINWTKFLKDSCKKGDRSLAELSRLPAVQLLRIYSDQGEPRPMTPREIAIKRNKRRAELGLPPVPVPEEED